MDADMAALCAANVAEAKRRTHAAHPWLADESDEDRHARLQAHVPRMCAWMEDKARRGLLVGDHEGQLRHWARRHQHQFSVDVASDHDVMSAGQVTSTVFVTVLAEDATEASLLAAQMASRHGIAVAVREAVA